MKIVIGSDHAGYDVKEIIIKTLKEKDHEIIDVGTDSNQSTIYSIYGLAVGKCINEFQADLGVVICGSGIGIMNAASKFKNTRTCLCREINDAKIARETYNANILALGARVNGIELIKAIVNTFITTKFTAIQSNINLVKQLNSLGCNFDKLLFKEQIDQIKNFDVNKIPSILK